MSINPTPVMLIVSTGASDLKIWCEDSSSSYKPQLTGHRLDPKQVRDIHQYILNNADKFTVMDPSGIQQKKPTFTIAESFDSRKHPPVRFKNSCLKVDSSRNANGRYKAVRIEDRYCILPAKLKYVVSSLMANENLKVVGGLFFGTKRDGREREPIASHRVLAEWFAKQSKLECGEYKNGTPPTGARVWWCSYLLGSETMESDSADWTDFDFPVRRSVTQRIDRAIRQFAENYNGDPPARVLLAATGGLGEINVLLRSSVRYRFLGRFLDLPETELGDNETIARMTVDRLCESTTDTSNATVPLVPGVNVLQRRESLDLRYVVEQQIWKGDIPGARSASVSVTHPDSVLDDGWTEAVMVAEAYIGRSRNTGGMNASSRSSPSTPSSEAVQNLRKFCRDKLFFDEYEPKEDGSHIVSFAKFDLLHTAFTVEMALQATRKEDRRTADASLLTSNFLDTLARAGVYQRLINDTKVLPHADWKKTRYEDSSGLIAPRCNHCDDNGTCARRDSCCHEKIRSLRAAVVASLGKEQFLNSRGTNKSVKVAFNNSQSGLLAYISQYTNQSVQAFSDKIRKQKEGNKQNGLAMRDFRNAATHRFVDSDQLSRLENLAFNEPSVWADRINANYSIHALGKCFIGVETVKKALAHYGLGNVQYLYQRFHRLLLSAVRQDIYVPSDEN